MTEIRCEDHSSDAVRRGDLLQFRLIYTATFILFLAAALIKRLLLPWHRGTGTRSQDKGTLFLRVKERAATFSALAFMG
jgi:hypothetical protein